jgi:hypothetical protein
MCGGAGAKRGAHRCVSILFEARFTYDRAMRSQLAWLALSLALTACGRVRFQPSDVGMDSGIDAAMSDAAMSDAAMNDAAMSDAAMSDAAMSYAAMSDALVVDVGFDAPLDVGSDAPRDVGFDAPMSDAGACAAILENEAAFTDAEVLACASRGGIGTCTIFDNRGLAVCGTCACEWYQQSMRTACGACPSRWTATGCTDFGAPPWAPECADRALGQDLAICMIRVLLRAGECTPCTCP